MIPLAVESVQRLMPSPRTRGDDPTVARVRKELGVFSPHPRG